MSVGQNIEKKAQVRWSIEHHTSPKDKKEKEPDQVIKKIYTPLLTNDRSILFANY